MEGTQKCLAGPKKWRLKSEQQTSTEKSADSIFWWHILTLLVKSQRALKKHVKNWTIGMHPKTKPKKKNNNNRDSHKRKDLIHEHLLQSLTQISMVLLALSLTRTAGFLHSVYRKKDENPLAFPRFPRILKTRLNTKLFMKWECFFHKRFFHKWKWFYKFWEQ